MAFTRIRKRENKSGVSYQAAVLEKDSGRDVTIWSSTFKTKGDAQAAAAEE